MPNFKCSREQEIMMKSFSESLPNLRRLTGVSQTVLGNKIGLSRQSISAIERGVMPMTWPTYVAIVAFFLVNKDAYKLDGELERNKAFIVKCMTVNAE